MTSSDSKSLPDNIRFSSEDAKTVEDECLNCGTALPMCLYWKIHGYVACCPECKHVPADAANAVRK